MQCKLWVEEDYLATTRLFANDNVQYYGMEEDYQNNLTPGENNTFAGYIGGLNGSFNLQDMFVYVDIAEGQSLRLGIRADGRQSDGTRHPEQKNGWFKVDYFRINKVEATGISSLTPDPSPKREGSWHIYDLQGRKVEMLNVEKLNEQMGENRSTFQPFNLSTLTPGIYIVKMANGESRKIVVK